jgi:centromere protein B
LKKWRRIQQKWIDIAKCLGLAPSTSNSIVVKEREIREQFDKSCKKRKTGRESAFCELDSVRLAWYQQARASGIPIDGNILCEKAKKIADRMQADNFSASNGWICRFKDRHGLVYKKLTGESTAVDTDMRDLWLETLPMLLK